MLSENMQKRYEEAYAAFCEMVEDSSIIARHRSLKKYEDKTNQDVLFEINGKAICGVYVAKDSYKIWLDNEKWHGLTERKPSEIKDDGYYSIRCMELEECLDELKDFFSKVYGM